MKQVKLWRVKQVHPDLQYILTKELSISKIMAQFLINRGICTVEQARGYLAGDFASLYSPWLLKDIHQAVDRIFQAIQAGERLLVYGDYDADGLTGTALLILALQRLGAQAGYYIPNRLTDGYGLKNEAILWAKEAGYNLLLSVDCGISAVAEVEYARTVGIDVIITDHHEPGEVLPTALAVVNPKRQDCGYPFKELAGVGVAFKLVQALYEQAGYPAEQTQDWLDLVCLGTVADIVPLQNENRILVKYGLPRLAHTANAGLAALMEVCGINKDAGLSTREVGYMLAPRLNAAGRMGDPRVGLDLLLCSDPAAALELARRLQQGNQERQSVESEVLAQALQMLEENPVLAGQKILVLASPGWHPGVIGIVAARLVERFYRPVLLVALENGEGKGSARSIPGFHLYQALTHCAGYLLGYGGHAHAAGFSIREEDIPAFRQELNAYGANLLTEQILTPGLELDGIVSLSQLSMEAVQQMGQLAPFGHGNPGPLLGCRQAAVTEVREVGKNRDHLKLWLKEARTVLDGIGFNMGAYSQELAASTAVDFAFVPSLNHWNGRSTVQLEIKDFHLADELAEPTAVIDQVVSLPEHLLNKFLVPDYIYEALPMKNWSPPERENAFPQRVEIQDCRYQLERPAFAAGLIKAGEPAVILVSGVSQALQLTHYLNYTAEETGGRAVFYHRLLPEDTVSRIKDLIDRTLPVLVTTMDGPAKFDLSRYKRFVFYHFPAQNKDYRFIKEDDLVYLLFNQQDWEADRRFLQLIHPDRALLVSLYTYLRKNNPLSLQKIAVGELLSQLPATGQAGCHKLALDTALTILSELKLLNFAESYGNYQINMLPAPAAKMDLHVSPTYRQGEIFTDDTLQYWQDLLDCSPDRFAVLCRGGQ